MRKIKILGIFFLFFFSFAHSQEKIVNFDVTIQIEKSGTIQVIEKITIKAEGNKFKHGLLRILPLSRKDKNNNYVGVEYQINSIKKDGVEEDYFTKEDGDDWKIYIGDKDIELESNTYQYQISYSTPYQIGYFDTYDELYWNVTGNSWEIPIDKATCQLFLPSDNSTFENIKCYTGPEGSTASNCNSSFSSNKTVVNFMTSRLNENEGFTVAASFAKGVIDPPTTFEKTTSFYNQIKTGVWSVIFGIGMFFFYLLNWKKHGKDPIQKTIIPEFRPPFGWSPAILGYVYTREIKDKNYMASLVNCAVKGAIKIVSSIESGVFVNSTVYEIEIKNKEATNLSAEEEALFKPLSKKTTLKVNNKNHKVFGNAYTAWLKSLQSQINLKEYYQNNGTKKGIGFLLFVIAGLSYIILSTTNPTLNYGFYIVALISLTALTYWIKKKIEHTGLIVLRFILAIFFGFPTIMLFFFTLFMSSLIQILVITLIFIIYLFYAFNLGKYTSKGTEAIQQIEGFKLYLETAEKDRINMLNAPDLTPQLFEELLPYAIVLNVEVAWGKKFEKILELAKYNPEWCNTEDDFYRRPTHFISGFTTSVNSSRIDPTKSSSSGGSGSSGSWSSGSSGGGSSGGGGGGGGGGGW